MDNNVPTQSANPLLAGNRNRIPGETFQLPSSGLFYNNGELDPSVINGELHVYPMTAYDEICLKTPDMLFSGEAIKGIIRRCVPQVQKPEKLLAKDIDFLLICLRAISFGTDVTVIHNHGCQGDNSKDHKYQVSTDLFMQQVKHLDTQKLLKEYVADVADMKVYISPIRFESFVKMMTAVNPDRDLTADEIYKESTEQMSDLISKVVAPDGTEVHDKTFIIEWLQTLTLPEMRILDKALQNLSAWGVDTTFKSQCQDCGEEITIVTPLNPVSFFT